MVKLKLRVGEKGQVLIPKLLRNKYGLKEGEEVTVELKDEGLLLKGRPSQKEVLENLQAHTSKLRSLGVVGSKLGDLRSTYLEMEYEVASS